MGFSVSGATAVILVGLLVSAATLYPAVDSHTERRSEAVDDRQERLLTQQNTEVEITIASYNATGDLTVSVKNTGATTLAVSKVDLLADGEYETLLSTDTTVDGDTTTDIWSPGETLTITVSSLLSSPGRVKIVTGPGVADTATVEVL